jgi:Aspartyl protease
MQIAGLWFRCDDGVTRPVVVVHLEAADGSAHEERFLVDCGADRTAFSADLVARLGLSSSSPLQLEGVGGTRDCVLVQTALEFHRLEGGTAVVRGEFAAFVDSEATELSVLGRDVTNNFDLILSRPRGEVMMLASPHRYRIEVN